MVLTNSDGKCNYYKSNRSQNNYFENVFNVRTTPSNLIAYFSMNKELYNVTL